MITKRQNLMNTIERSVSGRNLGAAETTRQTTPRTSEAREAASVSHNTMVTQEATHVVKSTTKHYKNTVVSIRFDEGDYERLTALALEQGSTAASFIRKAVKDIIREGA